MEVTSKSTRKQLQDHIATELRRAHYGYDEYENDSYEDLESDRKAEDRVRLDNIYERYNSIFPERADYSEGDDNTDKEDDYEGDDNENKGDYSVSDEFDVSESKDEGDDSEDEGEVDNFESDDSEDQSDESEIDGDSEDVESDSESEESNSEVEGESQDDGETRGKKLIKTKIFCTLG